MTQREVLRRYPRLTAHLICQSLGYFTPLSAANAICAHLEGRAFSCEWYSHMCSCRGMGLFHEQTLLDVGRDTLRRAFEGRHRHKGYMAEYQHALALVKAELAEKGKTSGMLAAWF